MALGANLHFGCDIETNLNFFLVDSATTSEGVSFKMFVTSNTKTLRSFCWVET